MRVLATSQTTRFRQPGLLLVMDINGTGRAVVAYSGRAVPLEATSLSVDKMIFVLEVVETLGTSVTAP